MALKLLAPGEARDKAKKTLESEKYRLVEVQSLITQKYRELSQAEKDFDDAQQKQRNQWAAEQQEHETKILSLRKSIESLEERKRQALLPLTEKAKELDTKSSVLDEREVSLNLRETNLRQGQESLMSRLDDVAERELQADKVSASLASKERGIQAQSKQIAASSAALTAAMASASDESNDRQRTLDLKESSLKAKEGNLIERERKVKETEAGFATREAAIRDERFALMQALDEINKQRGPKQKL